MRPQSIVNFERAVLASLGLGVLNSWVSWDRSVATVTAAGVGASSIIGIQAVMIALILLLVWFVARKASPVAKWIYVVITGLGLVASLVGLPQVMKTGALSVALTIVQTLLSIYSLWLLFRPDAKSWFNDGRGFDA